MHKYFTFLFLSFLFLTGCATKNIGDVAQKNGLQINPEYSFLLESEADRDFAYLKFPDQSRTLEVMEQTAGATSGLSAAMFDPGPLGSAVDVVGASAFIFGGLLEAWATEDLNVGNFMWMPYFSETEIDFDAYVAKLEKVLKDATTKYMDDIIKINSGGEFNLKGVQVDTINNSLFGKEKRIIVYLQDQRKRKDGNIITTDIGLFNVYLKDKCNIDLSTNKQYKDCISSSYLVTYDTILSYQEKYRLMDIISEISETEGLYLVYYYTNKIIKNKKAYNFLVAQN